MTKITPVGIDLGTTLSAAAYVGPDGTTRMIPNAEGELLTPSVVLFGDGERLVGREAWEAGVTQFERVAEHVKRDMGQGEYHREIRGCRYPPEVIQACILRQMQANTIAAVGESFQAVITAPAYFDQAQRKTTADAGAMSGLEILDIVNEPTAAALAYGEKLGYLSATGAPSKSMRLLVYDLGGGTFDVTIIELSPGRVRTLSTDGDVQLGGWDWDLRLVEHAKQALQAKWPSLEPLTEQEQIALERAAQQAKHQLSVLPETMLRFFGGWQNNAATDQPASLRGDDLRFARTDLLYHSANLASRRNYLGRCRPARLGGGIDSHASGRGGRPSALGKSSRPKRLARPSGGSRRGDIRSALPRIARPR